MMGETFWYWMLVGCISGGAVGLAWTLGRHTGVLAERRRWRHWLRNTRTLDTITPGEEFR